MQNASAMIICFAKIVFRGIRQRLIIFFQKWVQQVLSQTQNQRWPTAAAKARS